MALNRSTVIRTRDVAAYSWADIRRFYNQDYVADLLMKRHGLKKSDKENVNKQARQIRYCLTQAREYAHAADGVSLATKPTLAYYSIMSLALAEVLFKQTGDSSLDRMREHHSHHGLKFSRRHAGSDFATLGESAGVLFAEPVTKARRRFGTFELWHRSAREMPLTGDYVEASPNAVKTTEYRIILSASDARLPEIPDTGLSLLEVMQNLPGIAEVLPNFGVLPEVLRAKIGALRTGNEVRFALTIHPDRLELINSFLDSVIFHPSAVNRVDYVESKAGGGIIIWRRNDVESFYSGFPHGSMWTKDEIRFWAGPRTLNEFGYFYMALYIAGNYARYYPDKWMAAVEKCAPIALCIEELLNLASWRVPLLAASEFSGVYKILE